MPPEIPGFYYDSQRGRYFKITSSRERPTETYYHQQEIKKRKVNAKKEADAKNVVDECLQKFQEYSLKLADPFESTFGDSTGLRFQEGVKIEENRLKGPDAYEPTINSTFGLEPEHHEICSNIICEDCSIEGISLIFSTSRKLLKYQNSSLSTNPNITGSEHTLFDLEAHESVPSEHSLSAEYTVIKLEGNVSSPEGLYLHARIINSNCHVFVLLRETSPTMQVTLVNFKKHENVHDSLNLGEQFVVAVNTNLQLHRWVRHPASPPILNKRLDTKNKSDILTLAASWVGSKPSILYAGFRDGSIVSVPIGSESRLLFKFSKQYRHPKVRLIMTIKCSSATGLIFVSAIQECSSVVLMLDMMLECSECCIITFRSSFSNLTKEQELFQVTGDGHFVLYGSSNARAGKGGFELFSSHFEDNLNFQKTGQNEPSYQFFLSIRSTEDGIMGGIELGNKKIRALSFGKARTTHISCDYTTPLLAQGHANSKVEIFADNLNERSYYRLIMILEDSTNTSGLYAPSMALTSMNIV